MRRAAPSLLTRARVCRRVCTLAAFECAAMRLFDERIRCSRLQHSHRLRHRASRCCASATVLKAHQPPCSK
eukprot:6212304-Pleurochrysis_carterae.AAC.6